MDAAQYEEKNFGDDEIYCKCSTIEQFEKWCVDGFWDSVADFEISTGITFEDIEGVWFQVIDNRIYLKED